MQATIQAIKAADITTRKQVASHRVVKIDPSDLLPLSHPDVSLEEFHRRLGERMARKQV